MRKQRILKRFFSVMVVFLAVLMLPLTAHAETELTVEERLEQLEVEISALEEVIAAKADYDVVMSKYNALEATIGGLRNQVESDYVKEDYLEEMLSAYESRITSALKTYVDSQILILEQAIDENVSYSELEEQYDSIVAMLESYATNDKLNLEIAKVEERVTVAMKAYIDGKVDQLNLSIESTDADITELLENIQEIYTAIAQLEIKAKNANDELRAELNASISAATLASEVAIAALAAKVEANEAAIAELKTENDDKDNVNTALAITGTALGGTSVASISAAGIWMFIKRRKLSIK